MKLLQQKLHTSVNQSTGQVEIITYYLIINIVYIHATQNAKTLVLLVLLTITQ